MLGLERRPGRYAQLSSWIVFVHAFRPLGAPAVRELLAGWRPSGVLLADAEGIAAITRITGGNFRLLDRLLTQVARILTLNGLEAVTREVVEAVREVQVIGTAWRRPIADGSSELGMGWSGPPAPADLVIDNVLWLRLPRPKTHSAQVGPSRNSLDSGWSGSLRRLHFRRLQRPGGANCFRSGNHPKRDGPPSAESPSVIGFGGDESPLPRPPSALFPVPADEDPRCGSLRSGSRWSPETNPQLRGGTSRAENGAVGLDPP
jgi:hypothetical protein